MQELEQASGCQLAAEGETAGLTAAGSRSFLQGPRDNFVVDPVFLSP